MVDWEKGRDAVVVGCGALVAVRTFCCFFRACKCTFEGQSLACFVVAVTVDEEVVDVVVVAAAVPLAAFETIAVLFVAEGV